MNVPPVHRHPHLKDVDEESLQDDSIFPSKLHTTTLFGFWETKGARFYDVHGTTLHLFVMLFPV